MALLAVASSVDKLAVTWICLPARIYRAVPAGFGMPFGFSTALGFRTIGMG